MKKLFFFVIGAVVILFILLPGFRNKSVTNVTAPASANNSSIGCDPATVSPVNAIAFENLNDPPVTRVRRSIYSLSSANIASLKTGVAAMKALPYTDPTSWLYQAAIHGTNLPDALPSWNTCHMSGDEFFFLAWHRMYVYFFERILRAKSGNPNLTLPYWNYQSNPVIPPDFRDNTPGNPLYHSNRSGSMNMGASLNPSIMIAFTNSLNPVPYYDFQTAINGPHGSIHGSIGGDMQSVSTAAKDPIFWLHHCNIDRLWEVWLRKCNGRHDPTDAAWLTKTFTFFNETGTAVSLSGSQVVQTAMQLHYKYDFKFPVRCLVHIWPPYLYRRWPLLHIPDPYTINKGLLRTSFRQSARDSLDYFIQTTRKTKFNFDDVKAPDKLIIEFEDITVDKQPEGVVEVYLNLSPKEKPDPNSKSFVGLLDLFSAEHAARHHNMDHKYVMELDASRTAKALGLSIRDLKNAEISFYVRGNILKGKEIITSSNIRVGSTTLAIDIVKK